MNVEVISWKVSGKDKDRNIMGLGPNARLHLVTYDGTIGMRNGTPLVTGMEDVHGEEAARRVAGDESGRAVVLAVGAPYMTQYYDPEHPNRRDRVVRRHQHPQ